MWIEHPRVIRRTFSGHRYIIRTVRVDSRFRRLGYQSFAFRDGCGVPGYSMWIDDDTYVESVHRAVESARMDAEYEQFWSCLEQK